VLVASRPASCAPCCRQIVMQTQNKGWNYQPNHKKAKYCHSIHWWIKMALWAYCHITL
jgi:hypothetical protein